MDRWLGRVPSSLQGGARAFQVERTGWVEAHLVCAGSEGKLGVARARYVGGVPSWKGQWGRLG